MIADVKRGRVPRRKVQRVVKVIDRLDPWGRGTEMIGEVRA